MCGLAVKTVLRLACIGICLIAPPLAGVWLAGQPLAIYLAFPPLTRYVAHAPFSWSAFLVLAAVVTAALTLVALRLAGTVALRPVDRRRRFPRWGWLGLGLVCLAWLLAWSRFGWFKPLQHHTFTPLWLGYVLVMNALSYRRSGRCMLTHRRGLLLALFPSSTLFWWLFEWLNRFVQNWYYVGIEHFSALEYTLAASLSFSTVLPAVLSTLEWLQSFPQLNGAFSHTWRPPLPRSSTWPWLLLGAALAGSAGIGLWPDYLFALVWIEPALVVLSVQSIAGRLTPLSSLAVGDWRPVVLPALAALLCGFFWELWNFHSLAHWVYAVSYVNRFHLFEMPLLGYAGYLPFGIECLLAASLLPHFEWSFDVQE